jgi:hypothetical protein
LFEPNALRQQQLKGVSLSLCSVKRLSEEAVVPKVITCHSENTHRNYLQEILADKKKTTLYTVIRKDGNLMASYGNFGKLCSNDPEFYGKVKRFWRAGKLYIEKTELA